MCRTVDVVVAKDQNGRYSCCSRILCDVVSVRSTKEEEREGDTICGADTQSSEGIASNDDDDDDENGDEQSVRIVKAASAHQTGEMRERNIRGERPYHQGG